MNLLRDVVLLVLMLVACWTDIHTRKIKNWLTFPCMAIGLVWWLPSATPWAGAAGVGLVLLACLPLWRIGPVFSAGDVKMLMAAGALLGPADGLRAVLWSLVCGLPAGVLVLALRGRLGRIGDVLRGRAEATMLWHAPVLTAGILLTRLQPWPILF